MIDPFKNDQILLQVKYTDEDIQKAKDFMGTTLRSIVYPTNDLSELDTRYNEYLSMPKHGRFESDEMCRSIFKCNNIDLYTLIKSQILQNRGKTNDNNFEVKPISLPEQALFAESALNPLDEETIRMYEPSSYIQQVAKDGALKLGYFAPNTDYKNPDAEFPYFTSVEIIANKATLDDIPDGYLSIGGNVAGYFTYKEWFEGLQAAEHGVITEEYKKQLPSWIEVTRQAEYEYSKNPSKINEIFLSSLGWNPKMKFTAENRVKATNRFHKTVLESLKFDVVDLTPDLLQENLSDLEIPMKKLSLYPVYIVLVEGQTLFADITKKVTKGPFSHAAISLDESLNRMYSFNMATNNGGGLSIEDVKKYPQTHKLGVFVIFVKEQEYHTIKTMLEYYLHNIEKTSYSILNLMALPFNKAIKMNFSMICSEFVDNLLKVCNINITDKESPLVTPNDFYRASISNKKIYKIYEGKVNGYREASARKKIFKLLSSSKYIKEACLFEIKEFPIQFSSEGDLLIKNMKKINYEEEYSKSHKLLMAYDKADNIDGIKYELCKLWFLNQLLERDIYANTNAIANSKCRSRVLNDFNKYIAIVMKSDSSFNFSEYYNNTPFSDAVIKIKGSTLKYSMDYLKQALKLMV